MKAKKPIPYELSQWDNRTKVFYLCPKCGCDMRLLGKTQNFCYRCGQKLDWQYCIENVTEEIKELYWGFEKSFYNNEISYEEMKRKQNDLMFEIYHFTCEKEREKLKELKGEV